MIEIYFEDSIPGLRDWEAQTARNIRPVKKLGPGASDSWHPHIPSYPQTDDELLENVRYLHVTSKAVLPLLLVWFEFNKRFPNLKCILIIPENGRRPHQNDARSIFERIQCVAGLLITGEFSTGFMMLMQKTYCQMLSQYSQNTLRIGARCSFC